MKGAIKNRNFKDPQFNETVTEWKNLSDEQKTAEFYGMVIDLVKDYHDKIPKRTQENTSAHDSGMTQEEVAADPNLTTVVDPGEPDHDHELQDMNGAETDKGACKEPNSSTSAL